MHRRPAADRRRHKTQATSGEPTYHCRGAGFHPRPLRPSTPNIGCLQDVLGAPTPVRDVHQWQLQQGRHRRRHHHGRQAHVLCGETGRYY